MSNLLIYDAATHPIHSVTVHRSNQAQVTRHVNVHLKKGDNRIEIINLPKSLSNDSIRVDGIGDAVIRDIIYNPASVKQFGIELVSSSKIDALERERAQIYEELTIANNQSTLLHDYITSVNRQNTDTDQLPEVLQVFADEKRDIVARRAQLDEQMKAIDDKISQAETEVRNNDTSDQVSVVVVISAGAGGRADLSFSYSVSGVSWNPHYDLFADVDTPETTKDGSHSRVRLHYRASISQSSGEDWTNVQLMLSTASPHYATYIPTLTKQSLVDEKARRSRRSNPPIPAVPYPYCPEWEPYYRSRSPSPIRVPPIVAPPSILNQPAVAPISPRERANRSRSQNREARILRERSRSRSRSRSPRRLFVSQDDLLGITVAPPAFVQHSQATVTEHASGFNTIISLDGPSTIPSVSWNNSVTHNVGIAALEFPRADLERVAVLCGFPSVYLKCKVKNTSNYTLLGGNVNIFLKNSFIATSFIPDVAPQEFFSCSLGIDPNVSVTLHPQTKEAKESGSRIFRSKAIKTVTARSITVKNTGGFAIERLIVKDQVPVANDPKLKIHVVSPAGLPDIKEKSIKQVGVNGNKVKARWSAANQQEENDGEANEEGFIDWICQVGAGESLNLKLSWEVKAPKKLKWKVTV